MSETADVLDLAPRHALGLHALRRLRAGELSGEQREQAEAHVQSCTACRERLTQLDAETAHARSVMPFEKLADGVARRSAVRPRPRWTGPLGMALAAALALLVVPQLLSSSRQLNGIKGGGSDVQLYVGGLAEPRRVLGEAALQVGERVQLKVASDQHPYVAVLSVDEQGQVTPLYPQTGASRSLERGPAQFLPDSVAFDGRGHERLVAVFSDQPLQVTDLVSAAREDFSRSGSLAAMQPLGLGAEEIDRTVLKP